MKTFASCDGVFSPYGGHALNVGLDLVTALS